MKFCVWWGAVRAPFVILPPLVRCPDEQKRLNSMTLCTACVFQDEATELVVFVLHSLKNQRESHMMGKSGDEEEQQDIFRVSCLLTFWILLSLLRYTGCCVFS